MLNLFNELLFSLTSLLVIWWGGPNATIFLDDSVTPAQVQQLQQEISSMNGVTEVKYISQEEAYQIYVEANKYDPELIELITPEVLPASFEIQTNSAHDAAEIKKTYERHKWVDEIMLR